jgi:hypothetical protein
MSAIDNISLDESQEYFFVAMSMLYQRSKTNILPEMLQIITPTQMMQLVQLYGGKDVKLPAPKELSVALKASLFIYRVDFLLKNEAKVIEELELKAEELTAVRRAREDWYNDMKDKTGSGYLSAVKEAANA